MEAHTATIVTFCVALILFLTTNKTQVSLIIASMIMPSCILYAEFFMPYLGGGASMWPIAFVIGSCIGFTSALIGIGLGMLIQKIVNNKKA